MKSTWKYSLNNAQSITFKKNLNSKLESMALAHIEYSALKINQIETFQAKYFSHPYHSPNFVGTIIMYKYDLPNS